MVALAEWFESNEIRVALLDLDTEHKVCGSLQHFFNRVVTKSTIAALKGMSIEM